MINCHCSLKLYTRRSWWMFSVCMELAMSDVSFFFFFKESAHPQNLPSSPPRPPPDLNDRLILFSPARRGPRRPAALEAGDASAQVPAARPLAEVATQGAHVTERRRANGRARLGQC